MKRSSEIILERLRGQAASLPRPVVRLATLQRLSEACDAIEQGHAAALYRQVYGVDRSGKNLKLSPSSVERYVKARLASGDMAWTGPVRVTLQKDEELKAYIDAREDERLKPVTLNGPPTSRYKRLEDAISGLKAVEDRQDLRDALEEGRTAKRSLDIVIRGLRTIPGIDVDSLLQGEMIPNRPSQPPVELEIGTEARRLLTELVSRLTDVREMRRVGLETDGSRVRLAVAPNTTVVRPAEMDLLRRLIGFEAKEVRGESESRP